jgi:mRNA-degrading endonuclease RelE of RelBE toxin-antitoxin system
MAHVKMTPEAQRQFKRLPRAVRADMLGVYERLAQWPEVSGAKPLQHALAGHFRLRIGHYRVQFHVSGETVIVEKVGHRDGFYE